VPSTGRGEYVLTSSARTSKHEKPRSQTLIAYLGPSRADLESVLVAKPASHMPLTD
jgi:hypothetical protein